MPTYSKYNFTDCQGVQWVRGFPSSSPSSSSSFSFSSSSSSVSSSSSSVSSFSSSPGAGHFRSALRILVALKDLSPDGAFQWDGSWFGHPGTQLIDEYMGTPRVREMIDAGLPADAIAAAFEADAAAFRKTRAPYLLY